MLYTSTISCAGSIRGVPLALMKSHLDGRYEYVPIYNHRSSLLYISKGVPQGSVLGPLMFKFI